MKEELKIGYFADGPWAHESFQKIIKDNSLKIVFMCVRYDRQDPELIEYGKQYNIPVLISPNINSKEFQDEIEKYQADLFVSMSFNQIFRERLINLPPYKTINCHAGKLPFYRGRNILNWVLINDEKEFGITVHYMDEGIDTGDIILQETYSITDSDTYATLLERAYIGCADILYRAIKLIQNDTATRTKQADIDPVGLYCGMREPGDEVLDWNQSSRQVFNFVRALCTPGPMATCYKDKEIVRINKVKMIRGAHDYIGIPGQIIGKSETGILVKTRDTMIEIQEYQSNIKLKIGDRLRGECK